MRQQQIPLINFATAGVSVQEVAQVAFGIDFVNPRQSQAARYDFKTKYAESLGGADGYLYNKAAVLAAIKNYVAKEQTESL